MSNFDNGNASAPWAQNPAGTNGGGQWLSNPQNVKTLAGGIGIALGVLVVLGGGPQAKLFGLIIIAAAWAVFLRHGYHKQAGLRVHTRIPAEQAGQIITDLTDGHGARAVVQLTDSQPGRLNFIAHTRPNPLTFRVMLHQDPSGFTAISTHLVKWTWRQTRSYLIPLPFTKRIDGYGTYKAFAGRALEALRQRDPGLMGAFEDNPAN